MTPFQLLIIFIIFKQVISQVCNKTNSVIRTVPETYTYTYYEAYEDDDCLICSCTKSRQAVNTGTRLVERLENETVSVCCDGYIKDDSYDGDGLQCVPLCQPPCNNGYCRRPNECACEPGYAIDPNDVLNRCIPLCLDGCSIPDCLPTCSQYDDYDSSRSDMCFDTCQNGTCVAPGICHCDRGFNRVSETCEPVCSSCEHGTCIAPELCDCNPGWREECGSCQPICSGCEHGKCKAPGLCECDAGYRAENGLCEPDCSNCTNGNCIAPNICACDPGWYMNEAGTKCLAHCDVPCGNGSCNAPNHCECYSGYRLKAQHEGDDRWTEAPLCIPECSDCAWLCVAPELCKCEEHYETIYTTEDGKECDCIDCSNSSTTCNRVTCRINLNKTMNGNVERLNGSEIITASNKNLDDFPIGFANITPVNDINNSANDTTGLYTLKSAKFTYHWIYTSIIIVELLVILFLLALLKKKLQTVIFVPKDKHSSEDAVHYTTSVTCSKLKKTTELDI